MSRNEEEHGLFMPSQLWRLYGGRQSDEGRSDEPLSDEELNYEGLGDEWRNDEGLSDEGLSDKKRSSDILKINDWMAKDGVVKVWR